MQRLTDLTASFARSRFLLDEASRILALSDALGAGNEAWAARAFEAVALACGMDRIATDAGISRERLFSALLDPDRPDLAILSEAAQKLARNWAVDPGQDCAGAPADSAE